MSGVNVLKLRQNGGKVRMKLNLATKEGWTLSKEYHQYRMDGGDMSPEEWNQRIRVSQKIKQDIRRLA